MSWLDSSVPLPDRTPSLKRIDCRVIVDSVDCKGGCVWKEDRCLLHTPENFDIGSKQVNANRVLIFKLIEELIRFPVKREQLLKQDVSQYVKITQAFRSGNQYIVPENLPAWTELLRMEWNKKQEHKYLEEYSAIQAKPFIPDVPVISMNTQLINTYFGDGVTFVEEPSGSITKILEDKGIKRSFLKGLGQEFDAPIMDLEIARNIAKKLRLSIYQLLFEPDNPIADTPIIVKLGPNAVNINPFLLIVKLPDESVGYITQNSIAEIPYLSLPPKIKTEAKQSKVVLFK
jgi:hypothetical protein